jgi:hypothetical protein
MGRYITIVLFFITAAAVPARAATVSILVIETGLQKDLPSVEFSRTWEDALMDSLFESGHIVSNVPILRLPGSAGTEFPEEAARAELRNAQEGKADFLVVALLDYRGVADTKAMKPRGVTFRLFQVNPAQAVFERTYSGELPSPGRAAGDLVPHIIRIKSKG